GVHGVRVGGGPGVLRHHALDLPRRPLERTVLRAARLPPPATRRTLLGPARGARARAAPRHRTRPARDDAPQPAPGAGRLAAPPRAVRRRVWCLQPHRALAARRRSSRRAPVRSAPGSDGGGVAPALPPPSFPPRQHY